MNPSTAVSCDCGYSFATGEPPRSSGGGGDPAARWFGNLGPSGQRFAIRMAIFGVMLIFALGIAMCGR